MSPCARRASISRPLLMSLRDHLRFRRARSSLRDRKSTRLNSSHSQISYAVFCLKKKILIPERYLVLVNLYHFLNHPVFDLDEPPPLATDLCQFSEEQHPICFAHSSQFRRVPIE